MEMEEGDSLVTEWELHCLYNNYGGCIKTELEVGKRQHDREIVGRPFQ